MTEKSVFIVLALVYLGTFIARNAIVRGKTKQRIRASDPLVTASVILMNLCILTTIFATASERFYNYLVVIPFLRSSILGGVGFVLFAAGILLGWVVSAQLKTSWRVGVHGDQKTELIQTGIYRFIRNPYFLTYFMMLTGIFFIRPSLVSAILTLGATGLFHKMVLKEEAYLHKVHGGAYEAYKKASGRYLPRL